MLTVLAVVTVIVVNINFLGKSIAEMSGATILFYRAMTVIAQLQGMIQSLISSHGFYIRITERINQANRNVEKFTGKKTISNVHRVRFEKVGIAFGERCILKDVNASFHQGRLAVVIGPSGCGKSTLVDMVAGLNVPNAGNLLIDDVSISDLNINKWRQQVGYVGQEIFPFTTTLSEAMFSWDERVLAIAMS